MEELNNKDNFEQEQIQQILIQESKQNKIKMDRELKEQQDREYEESLLNDKYKQNSFDEPSLEEMRRVRLLRFSN